jgi:hypothetical protein
VQYQIMDLGSRNGTYVGDRRVVRRWWPRAAATPRGRGGPPSRPRRCRRSCRCRARAPTR